MDWQICIQYPSGKERVLRSCKNREVALRYVDAIYSEGYPLHIAYTVRPAQPTDSFTSGTVLTKLQLA